MPEQVSKVQEWINKKRAEKEKTTTTLQGNNNPTKIKIVGAMTAYVNKVGQDGWVTIKVGEKNKSIYKYTKLTLTELDKTGKRVIFTIEEGAFKGQKGSMIIDNGALTYLSDTAPIINEAAKITLKYGKREKDWKSNIRTNLNTKMPLIIDQQLAILTIKDDLSVVVTLNSEWNSGRKPLKKGTYEIGLPDFPHSQEYTQAYKVGGKLNQNGTLVGGNIVKYHTVWFPIYPLSEQRYIHIGHISHGCVTIIDYHKYPEIHEFLIQHRGIGKNGDTIVATLQVDE